MRRKRRSLASCAFRFGSRWRCRPRGFPPDIPTAFAVARATHGNRQRASRPAPARVFRQVDQHRATTRGASAVEVETVVADHHQLRRRHVPASGDAQQAIRVRFGPRLAAPEDVLGGEAAAQADRFEGDQRQLVVVAGQDAQAHAAPLQLAHQFQCARRRPRGLGQGALVFEQPGVLGRRLGLGQGGEVQQDVVLLGDVQRSADRREVVHGPGQGAVHVEHPVADVGQPHAQSSRLRIRPSWLDEATSWPLWLKMLPRTKPRALPAQGLSMA